MGFWGLGFLSSFCVPCGNLRWSSPRALRLSSSSRCSSSSFPLECLFALPSMISELIKFSKGIPEGTSFKNGFNLHPPLYVVFTIPPWSPVFGQRSPNIGPLGISLANWFLNIKKEDCFLKTVNWTVLNISWQDDFFHIQLKKKKSTSLKNRFNLLPPPFLVLTLSPCLLFLDSSHLILDQLISSIGKVVLNMYITEFDVSELNVLKIPFVSSFWLVCTRNDP